MEITSAGTPSSVAPVAPVTSSSGEEQSAQVLCEFGYLALLLNENQKASTPELVSEIKRVVNEIANQEPSDPEAQELYMNAFSYGDLPEIISGNGTINSTAASLFLTYWNSGSTNSPDADPFATQVMNWLTGADNNGTPPFNLSSSQDPTTVFNYLMFMSAVNLTGNASLEADAETLMGQTGEIPFTQTAGYFLAAYAYENGISPSMLTSLFVGNANTPDLDQFITFFQNLEAGNGWTPPAGMTGSEALSAMLATIEPYLPGANN